MAKDMRTQPTSEFHPHIPAGRKGGHPKSDLLPAIDEQGPYRENATGGFGGGRQPFFLKNPAGWDVGMEFGDVGCVRISFAINSNPFSAHSH